MLAVLNGSASREEVADWATGWVCLDNPDIDDEVVWTGVRHLAGADLQVSLGIYLYHDIDFHAWLDELQNEMDHKSPVVDK